jgi:hypothetical protein
MIKKIVTYLLLFSFLHFVGCYSTDIVAPNQYKKYIEKGEIPSEILVRLYNLKEYSFAPWSYIIKEDSLYGEGFELVNDSYQPFEGTIPLSQIQSIQFEKKDSEKTNKLVYGMVLVGLLIIVVVLAGAMAKSVGEGVGKATEQIFVIK